MDNSSQTLELQIKAKAQEAKANVESLVKSLTNVENVLTNIYLELGSIEKKAESSINKATTNVTKNVNQLKQATDKATSSTNKLNSALKNVFTFAGAKKSTITILEGIKSSMDYSEALNLFNVVFKNIEDNGTTAFSKVGAEAIKFQNKLNEAFGTSKEQTLTYQALYQSMAENMGIVVDKAGVMSENTVKLVNDLSSLYNKSENSVATALSSGIYAGQVRPLRTFGIDITEKSLQPILDSLGIERTVRELSQAEKQILRYIAVVKQSSVAHADWAQTIESPSNQLKILSNQAKEAKTYLSSLFVGTFAQILPYLNAFLMVVKEVSKAVASMFGIELKDYNSGIASQEGIYDGIADSADDASSAVKELKRQTLGFDEIHNINENNNSGSGTSVSGGIDQRLLDAITGYDNGMDKVRMKATEIRDRIMEWLGFTKEIDPLTGEVSFKLKEGETRFQGILDFAKKIKDVVIFALEHVDTIIKTIIGYKILTWLSNVYSKFKDIKELIKDISGSSFAKWGLGIAGGIGLAQIISKTDAYQNLTGNQGTIFDMWGEIGSGIKETKNSNKTNKENSYNRMFDALAGIDYTKGKGKDTTGFEKLFNEFSKEYYDRYQYTKDFSDYTITHPSSSDFTFDYQSALEDFRNQIYDKYTQDALGHILENFGQSFLNNDDVVNITTYKDALQTYFDTISDGYNIVDGYIQKINENDIAYTNTSISLGTLLTKLTNEDYKATEEEIEKINDLFKQMGQISDDTAEQNYLAITKIISNLQKNGYASDELTQKIMDNAFKQKEAEKGRTQEQIEALLELKKQYNDGEISQKEYQQKLVELSATFDKTNLVMGKAKVTFDTLSQSVDLTAGSYDEANNAISELKDAHKVATDTINNGTKDQIDLMTEYMAKIDRTTEQGEEDYQTYMEALSKLRQKERDDLKELDDTYALALANMLQSLINSKDSQTEESQKLQSQLNEELKKIGKDVDLTKNVEEINRQLGKITGKTECVVTVSAEQDTNSFTKVKTVLSKMFGGLFSFGGSSSGGTRAAGGIYSNGSWKNIPQYANGGSPSHGTMFVAGEAGAEIVGHINGKTEVLNQSQIASAIYSAVYSAMSQFGGGGIAEINVHADKGLIVDTSIEGINQKTRQTGVCPINIPTY